MPEDGNVYGNRISVVGYCTNNAGSDVTPSDVKPKGGSNVDSSPQGHRDINPDGRVLLARLEKANIANRNLVNSKLIHLISDIGVLIYAYELIKSKKGNMTKGSTSETLDGITLE